MNLLRCGFEDQWERIQRVFTEEFYLLGSGHGARTGSYVFTVNGSKMDKFYNVVVDAEGKMTCTCMDSRMTCPRKDCVCKHCCFVVYRVLNVMNNDFLKTLRVEDGAIGRWAAKNDARYNTAMANKLVHNVETTFDVNLERMEDDCPVCCDALGDDGTCVGCPECRNNAHKACMSRWMSQRKTCVWCRSNVWMAYA